MKLTGFIARGFCEPDGKTPSSHRMMLAVLLIFTLNLLACGFYMAGGLPVVPESLADLIKWLFTALITGVGVGKVTGAYQAIKAQPQDQNPVI